MREEKGTEFARQRARAGMSIEEVAYLLTLSSNRIRAIEAGNSTIPSLEFKILKAHADNVQGSSENREPSFRFIDLFAGIGGLRRGFEAAGGQCVFTSEIDAYAQKTYQANFDDDHEIVGDITEVEASEIPEHDVLLAGFPCQPFSIAGVSKKKSLGREHGFMDKAQGTLFFDVLRILKHHRPAAFLLENVKNLKSHNKGDTFRTIMGALEDELGYSVSYRVIDAKGYVPQHRERVFIAGFKEDTGFDFENLEFADPKSGPRLSSILHAEGEEPEGEFTLSTGKPGANVRSLVNEKYTLSDKLWNYLVGYAAKHKAKGNGFGYGLNGPDEVARTLSARYYKDGSEILITQESGNPRRLTPRECARLMGFDHLGRPPMVIPVSDTRAYKQFGNAVVVPVVEEVARHMKPHIEKNLQQGSLLQPAAE